MDSPSPMAKTKTALSPVGSVAVLCRADHNPCPTPVGSTFRESYGARLPDWLPQVRGSLVYLCSPKKSNKTWTHVLGVVDFLTGLMSSDSCPAGPLLESLPGPLFKGLCSGATCHVLCCSVYIRKDRHRQ